MFDRIRSGPVGKARYSFFQRSLHKPVRMRMSSCPGGWAVSGAQSIRNRMYEVSLPGPESVILELIAKEG